MGGLLWPIHDDYECVGADELVAGMAFDEPQRIRVQHPAGRQLVVAPRLDPERRKPRRVWYDAGETVGLDRILAEVPLTVDGVLAFARKYGMLGTRDPWELLTDGVPVGPQVCDDVFRDRALAENWPNPFRWTYGRAEPFAFWIYHITRLRTLRRIRDLVDSGDAAALRRLADDTPGPRDKLYLQGAATDIARGDYLSGFMPDAGLTPSGAPPGFSWAFVEFGDARLGCRLSPYCWGVETCTAGVLLAGDPNASLVDNARWALCSEVLSTLKACTREALVYGSEPWPRRFGLWRVPETLLGAAYTRLLETLSTGKEHRVKLGVCERCGDYFEQRNAKRRTCSDSCRTILSRKGGRATGTRGEESNNG